MNSAAGRFHMCDVLSMIETLTVVEEGGMLRRGAGLGGTRVWREGIVGFFGEAESW